MLSLVTLASGQLLPVGENPAPARPAPAPQASEQETSARTGEPQAAQASPADTEAKSAPTESHSAPQPATDEPSEAKTPPTAETTVANGASATQVEKPAAPDMSAFIAALAAAERANENLAARLAQMEASAALQRERDQAFIRDMIRGVLVLAGTMASIGMLALVAIVYLQVRSTKQQAITFAAQLQAITSHAALPGPSVSQPAALASSRNHFDSTAQKIEQRLSDLESMTSGLPEPGSHATVVDAPPQHDTREAEVGYTAPQPASNGASRGDRSSDLLSKASSLLMQQQPEVALAYIDQAISQNPRNPEAHLKRGAALERLNRLNEAITSYDRAIDAEPTLSTAFLAKAGVLNKLQRYGEALKCYEAALAQQGGAASESPAA